MQALPDILPRPRFVERLDATTPIDAPVMAEWVGGLPEQGYTLDIGREGVRLGFSDRAGERYGRATLEQIRAESGATLPGVRVRDWPDFPQRGYMLDVSRDRVPTRSTLQRLVELLAQLRINHLQLYTEHTFRYQHHRPAWCDASPLTSDDIAWLDRLCSSHGVELAANQNGFGHMERWLKRSEYRDLAEAPDGWKTSWGETWKAGVLYPDERSLRFVLDLYRELRPCFSSKRININFDETFELGKGRSKVRVEREGRARVYFEFLRAVVDELHRDGADVLFWGDVLRNHPELVAELPKRDLTALVWHYEAPVADPELPAGLEEILAEVGIDNEVLRGFAGQVPTFAKSGIPFWVCPGTSTWNSLLGRWSNATANLIDAAENGATHGAQGYLITDWGDNGHHQPPSASFAPLVYGASLAWCTDSNRDLEVTAALDRDVFRDSTRRLGAAVVDAAELYRKSGAEAFNGSPLFYALIGKDTSLGGSAAPTEQGIDLVLAELDRIDHAIAFSSPECSDGSLVKRELLQATRLTRIAAGILARKHGIAVPSTASEQVEQALHEQRACWLERSRPGGLDDSIAKLKITAEAR